jgi:hypothetical protein
MAAMISITVIPTSISTSLNACCRVLRRDVFFIFATRLLSAFCRLTAASAKITENGLSYQDKLMFGLDFSDGCISFINAQMKGLGRDVTPELGNAIPTHMSGMTPKNLGKLILLVCGLALPCLWILNRARDSSRAAMVEAIVREAMVTNIDLKRRFGTFIRLSGEGYERPKGIVLITRIELERVAEFERASVGVNISVFDPPAKNDEHWHIGQWQLVTGGKFRHALHVSIQPGSAENAPLQIGPASKP